MCASWLAAGTGDGDDRIEMVHLIFEQMFRDSDAAMDHQILNFQSELCSSRVIRWKSGAHGWSDLCSHRSF